VVVFRLGMAVVIALFAWRTYEEVAIARARSSGTLERADATVVNRTEERKERRGGTGQDRTSETFVRYEVTLELRVNGEVVSTRGGGRRVLDVGDHAQVGLWHGHVVELDGDYVWRGWHSGLGGNTLVVFYPLAMGYLIVLAAAARTRVARRAGPHMADLADLTVSGSVLGIFVGWATIIPLALGPAALGTEHPRFWPIIPVATGTAATLLLIRGQLRRRQSKATRAAADDTVVESGPARP
jgi:hypothetical protein